MSELESLVLRIRKLEEENERQNWKITDLQRQLCSLRAKLRMGLKI